MATRLTRSGRVIKFIEAFCRVPEGAHVGKPLKLEPFQRKFLRDVYDNPHGTRMAILSIARKNGKSGLIAGILLAHLVGPEAKRNSQIVSGAMSRDQAALVFSLAWKMVQLSPKLSEVVKIVPSGKRLIGLPLNTEYRALAADGTTAQGLSPVLAILDEVGQVRGPRSEFVEAITTSQGAHAQPLLVAISTQAPNDADLLSVWIDDALSGADLQAVCHLYAAQKDCELEDRTAWSAANPALGKFRSLEDMERHAKAAARMPTAQASFRNLYLNQRVEAVAPFVSFDVWKSNAGVVAEYDGEPVWIGLDLSAVADLTAMVAVWRTKAGIWQVRSEFWVPANGITDRARRDRVPYDVWADQGFLRTTPGESIDLDRVAADVIAIVEPWNVQKIAYDPWRFDQFKAALVRQGAGNDLVESLEKFIQGTKSMTPALDALERELLEHRMAHAMHPVLTMCAANVSVVIEKGAAARKFDKSRRTGRIDGMVALAMAIGVTAKADAEPAPEITFL